MPLSQLTAPQTEMPHSMASVKAFGHIRNQTLQHLIAWRFAKRGERPMLALCDIDPKEIRSTLGQIWLCDYLPESGRIRYRLAGDEINDFWGCNLVGKYLDEIVPAERLASVTKRARLVLDLPAVVYDRACLSLTEEITRKGERVILPLSDDGITVNALLGATHGDWFGELEFDPYVTRSESTTIAAL